MQVASAICFVLLVVGALSISKQSYQTRVIYKDIDGAYRDRIALETLQDNLRIERGSLLSPAYIEGKAKYELAMSEPANQLLISLPDADVSGGTAVSSLSDNLVLESNQ